MDGIHRIFLRQIGQLLDENFPKFGTCRIDKGVSSRFFRSVPKPRRSGSHSIGPEIGIPEVQRKADAKVQPLESWCEASLETRTDAPFRGNSQNLQMPCNQDNSCRSRLFATGINRATSSPD